MGRQSGIFLVTKDSQVTHIVQATLARSNRFASAGIGDDLADLSTHLAEKALPAALVDIDAEPNAMLEELEEIISRYPQTRFVVVSQSLTNGLMLAAMEAGARHFLVKPSLEMEVLSILERLAQEDPRHRYISFEKNAG